MCNMYYTTIVCNMRTLLLIWEIVHASYLLHKESKSIVVNRWMGDHWLENVHNKNNPLN